MTSYDCQSNDFGGKRRYALKNWAQLASGQCFPDCGVWVSVDFDSKYKILRVKLGPSGYLFMKE